MKTGVDEIERLERAVLTEARDEADQMKAEAKAKADDIHRRAQDQAESARKEILDRAHKDAERLRGQAAATAQLKARSLELQQREQLLDRVFKTAMERLPEIQDRPDYDEIAASLLREALTQLRVKQAEVKADDVTERSLNKRALNEVSKDLEGEFKLGDSLKEGRGIIVDAADGRLHYDNTLETRLARLQAGLRASVYKVLMGAKP
jgi:V/A-type H+-transporting ATPase subunit E